MGYDWAGHIRALDAPIRVLAKVNSSRVSTLGATEPTGSELGWISYYSSVHLYWMLVKDIETNLTMGTGYAWPGHCME